MSVDLGLLHDLHSHSLFLLTTRLETKHCPRTTALEKWSSLLKEAKGGATDRTHALLGATEDIASGHPNCALLLT